MSMQIARSGGNPSRQIDLATGEVRQRFVALDRYADEGYVQPQGLPTLAKISAGYKDEKGLPQASHDGTIYLSDPDNRATNLRKALEAADNARRDDEGKIRKVGGNFEAMRLQIALPFDAIDDNLSQSFVRYSAGRLEARGDLEQITELKVTEWEQSGQGGRRPKQVERHVAWRNGSACGLCDRVHSYRELKRTCQVVWNLVFTLGVWVGEGETALAKPLMPDGLGVYRLTSASSKGLNDIGQYLDLVAELCHGRLRGTVLDLMLTYPVVFDPLGVRRNQVPRWTVVFKPPAGIVLDPRRWAALAAASLAEGAMLALPAAPVPQQWDEIEQDMAEMIEPDADVLDQLLSGDLPAERNAEYWRREYFGNVSGTSLATDIGRARFLLDETGMAHLPEVISTYTNSQMQELLGRAIEKAARERLGAPVEPKAAARPAGGELEAETIAKARKYDRIMDMAERTADALRSPRPASVFGPESEAEVEETIEAECMGCGALGTCLPTEEGAYCQDQAACLARQEQDPPNAVASTAVEPSPPPVVSPAVGGEGVSDEVDTGGRPVDTPDVQAATIKMVPELIPTSSALLAELRPDVAGGEIFLCAGCGKQVGSVKVMDKVLTAREWLTELATTGLDRPLCLADAQKEARARRASKA